MVSPTQPYNWTHSFGSVPSNLSQEPLSRPAILAPDRLQPLLEAAAPNRSDLIDKQTEPRLLREKIKRLEHQVISQEALLGRIYLMEMEKNRLIQIILYLNKDRNATIQTFIDSQLKNEQLQEQNNHLSVQIGFLTRKLEILEAQNASLLQDLSRIAETSFNSASYQEITPLHSMPAPSRTCVRWEPMEFDILVEAVQTYLKDHPNQSIPNKFWRELKERFPDRSINALIQQWRRYCNSQQPTSTESTY